MRQRKKKPNPPHTAIAQGSNQSDLIKTLYKQFHWLW